MGPFPPIRRKMYDVRYLIRRKVVKGVLREDLKVAIAAERNSRRTYELLESLLDIAGDIRCGLRHLGRHSFLDQHPGADRLRDALPRGHSRR